MQRLIKAAKKVAGFKQTTKAVENGSARLVYVARDADDKIRVPVQELSQAKGVPLVEVDSMKELGQACGIQIGTAAAAVISFGDTPEDV